MNEVDMLRVLWNEKGAIIVDIVSCSAFYQSIIPGAIKSQYKKSSEHRLRPHHPVPSAYFHNQLFRRLLSHLHSITVPMKLSSAVLAAILLAQPGIAHPGQSQDELQNEIQQRAEYLSTHKRTLADCADKLKARGNDAILQARRSGKLENLRKKRSIDTCRWSYVGFAELLANKYEALINARSFEDVLNKDHHSNLTVTPETDDPSIIFTGNASCMLTPETTEGPYWVSGELVRENIVETQEGVPLTLDIQVVDVNNCEPIPQVYTEIWHCNSTGVYSGVVARGNGNQADASNLDNTALRGIQLTDDDGVVAFETLFPGHCKFIYLHSDVRFLTTKDTGRATHIHVLTHLDATLLPNNTVTGGNITHVGQFFFDQKLITLVEKEEVYASNTQTLTTNVQDGIFSQEAKNVDPVVEYVLLGDNVSEGLFGWIAFGVDTSASRNVTPAVYLTENGGVENPNAGAGGPGGPPPGFPTSPRPTTTTTV